MGTEADFDLQPPAAIRAAGIKALTKELGPVGMARFIQQYDHGLGDYTAERAELLADLTSMDDIKRELDQFRAKKRGIAE